MLKGRILNLVDTIGEDEGQKATNEEIEEDAREAADKDAGAEVALVWETQGGNSDSGDGAELV